MTRDDAAPATKGDIRLLIEHMRDWKREIQVDMKDWKDEFMEKMQDWKREIQVDMKAHKVEIFHEFHIVAENLRHDTLGIYGDKTSVHEDRLKNHERRIKALENHAHIIA